jgi:hypothetical protein
MLSSVRYSIHYTLSIGRHSVDRLLTRVVSRLRPVQDLAFKATSTQAPLASRDILVRGPPRVRLPVRVRPDQVDPVSEDGSSYHP